MRPVKYAQILLRTFFAFTLIGAPHAYVSAGTGEVVYNVSGLDGEDDTDGKSYNSRASSEMNGRNGGNAVENPNQDGQDAGELYLNISYDNAQTNKVIGIEGYQIKPGTRTKSKINDQVPLNSSLEISALAVGGEGGEGGDSGKGQDGGHGVDGRDAYHIGNTPVHGTDGTNAGHGGNEGDPTSGGDAGHGGIIKVVMSIFDADLAMLLNRINVSGNRGGAKGRKLGPGRGGRGGDGGSSDYHTWQEQTGTRPVYSTRSVTNSEGQIIDSETYQSGTEPVYTTRSSTAYGGSDGSDGSSGRSSTKTVYDGKDSLPGRYEYIIVDEEGNEKVYDGPYNLVLQPDYQLVGSLNNNGFFEPGETINIRNLKVTNNGKSPSPKYQEVRLFVTDNSRWIRTKSVELKIPQVLNPGESYTFSKEDIPFYLEEKPVTQPGVMVSEDTIAPKARVTRVEREFEDFNSRSKTSFQIRHPIEITSLTSMDSLAPGEFSKVLFKVKNISQQTIGKVDGNELRSAFAHLRRVDGDTEKDQFFIFDHEEGKLVKPRDGMGDPLEGLKPGKEMVVEGIVGLGKKPTPYSDVVIQPELYLESNLNKDQHNKIQYEPFKIRVSEVFKHDENSDILLVANNNLDDSVLEAIKHTAKVKNLDLDIWDFSYYGFFNLHESIEGWDNFFSAYRNKTIIVMGNEISTPAGGERVQNLLSPDEVIEAARRYGIRVMVIDTDSDYANNVAQLTTPIPSTNIDPDQVLEFDSIDKYIGELESEVKIFDEEIDGDADHFLGMSEVKLSTWRLWGKPEEAQLKAHANIVLAKARAKAPEASLFIDYEFKPEVKKNYYLWKTWDLGQLKIRRSVDTSRTSVVSMHVDQKDLQNPNFIMSREFQAALDMGLHIDTKLKLISSILSGTFEKDIKLPTKYAHLKVMEPMEYADTLIRSVLMEIVHEQLQIRPFNFNSEVDKDTLENKLDILSRVANYSYAQTELDPDTKAGKLWVRFIAQLKFFSKASLGWFERTMGFLFQGKNYQVSVVTYELIDRMIKNVFDDALMEEANGKIDAIVERLEDEKSDSGVKKQQVSTLLSGLDGITSLFTNGEVNTDSESRVRGKNEQDRLDAADERRLGRNIEIDEAYDAKSDQLKLDKGQCAMILAKAEMGVAGAKAEKKKQKELYE